MAVGLTPEDLREIESAAAQITAQGARYPDAYEQRTGLSTSIIRTHEDVMRSSPTHE